VLIALAGCSRNSGNFATVSGVITYKGTPVEGAKVTFHSTAQVDGKPGTVATVMTDSSGKYVIASAGKDPGIPPGMYKVTVTKLKGGGNVPLDPAVADPGQLEAAGAGGGALHELPPEYANVGITKLSVTLETGKNENKNFDLKGNVGVVRPMGTP